MRLKKYLLISATIFAQHNYSLERIQSQSVDKGKVQKIYVAPGLATLMRFPCVIKEAVVGNSELVNAKVSEKDSQSVILSISAPQKTATNLIVRCVSTNAPFVFDVISSRKSHQDYMDISAGYGRPKVKGMNLHLIDSSKSKSKKSNPEDVSMITLRKKRLLKTYKIKGKGK